MSFLFTVRSQFILTFALCCAAAMAQTTVGELTADKGKKLEADEVKKLVSDSRMTGIAFGYPIDFKMSADGKLNGSASPPGGVIGVWGTWQVNEEGQLCMDRRYSSGASKGCVDLFLHNGSYYAAGKKGGDKEPLSPRQFKPLNQ